jgi:hypothetical protein
MTSAIDPTVEAERLCEFIQATLREIESLTAAGTSSTVAGSYLLLAVPAAAAASAVGDSSLPWSGSTSAPVVFHSGSKRHPAPVARHPSFDLLLEDEGWSADKLWEGMDATNVDRMLDSSVKPATAEKYARIWDKWAAFAAFHEVDVLPPEVRALEIFVVDTVEFSGSAGIAATTAAAVSHFCALEGFESPFGLPSFGKILRGIRNSYGKAARPKRPFTPEHIVTFINLARKGTLREWRAALPLALCFQQLLLGSNA